MALLAVVAVPLVTFGMGLLILLMKIQDKLRYEGIYRFTAQSLDSPNEMLNVAKKLILIIIKYVKTFQATLKILYTANDSYGKLGTLYRRRVITILAL